MPRIYLPMSNREEGYCVTENEQRDLARRFGIDRAFLADFLMDLSNTMVPQKTANKTKALIFEGLKTVMLSGSGRLS